MIKLIAQCPACKARYKITKSKLIGPRLQCSRCRTPFRIKIPAGAAPKDEEILEDVFVEDVAEEPAPGGGDDFDWVNEDLGEELGEEIVPEFDVVEEYEEVDDYDEVEEDDDAEEYYSPAVVPQRGSKKRKSAKSRRSKRAGRDEHKKADGRSGGKSKTPMLVGVGVVVLLLLTGLFFLGRAAITGNLFAGKKLETPENYEHFVHSKWIFNCEYPSGWEVENGGGQGGVPAWARFESGSTLIRFKDCMSNQTIINVEKVAGGLSDKSPAANVHWLRRDELKDDYGGYQEQEPESTFNGFGEAVVSEFTAKTMLGRKLHGFRVTMLGASIVQQYEVLCVCPDSQWQALEPAFRRVIESMAPGSEPPEDVNLMFGGGVIDEGEGGKMEGEGEFEEGGEFPEGGEMEDGGEFDEGDEF